MTAPLVSAVLVLDSFSTGEKAIAALNGMQVGGRALTVNEARPQRERGDRKGGFGGDRKGGFGGGRKQGGHARNPREPRW